MAAKEISVKTYVVRLSGEERQQLETLIRKGKSPARRLLKARILLKADVSGAGEGWSDSRIIEALDASPSIAELPGEFQQSDLGADNLLFSRHGLLQCAEAGRFVTPTAPRPASACDPPWGTRTLLSD